MKTDFFCTVAAIMTAYLTHNSVEESEIAGMIKRIADALATVQAMTGSLPTIPEEVAKYGPDRFPAVPIERSVYDDCLICLEDGAKLKMLKRHLRTHFNMSFEEYKAKWGLPDDYPAVAPAYSRVRSELATRTGFQPMKAA